MGLPVIIHQKSLGCCEENRGLVFIVVIHKPNTLSLDVTFSDKQAKGKNSKPGKSKGKSSKQPVTANEARDGRNNLIGSKCLELQQ